MNVEKVSIQSEGQTLSGILHLPDRSHPPCVIASHGLLSSKDSEKYKALGEQLAGEGLAMLRFDFRGIGESEGKLEEDSVSRRIVDLGAVVRFVSTFPGLGKSIGLVGSSLGGYVSLFRAARHREIKAAAVWATPLHLDDLGSKEQKEDYPLPGEVFFRDLPRHRLLPVLPKIARVMVIHGEADELVPVDQAWEIFLGLGSPKEIHLIEGADHRLTQPDHRRLALDLTAAWFKKFL